MLHDFERLRTAMVEDQIEGRGVRSHDVLEAMRAVPREVFLPPSLHEFAYEDAALMIDEERTLPHPQGIRSPARHARCFQRGLHATNLPRLDG